MDFTKRETRTEERLFGVPQPDGSYKALKGRWDFDQGKLVRLSLQGGGTWEVPSIPIAPVVLHLFAEPAGVSCVQPALPR